MKYPTPNTRNIQTPRDLAMAYKQGPYAWPGGYPVMLVLADGACLCFDCYKSQYGSIAGEIGDSYNTGWKPAGVDINYEDTDCYCAHCNKQIESAYGDDTE